MVIGDVHGQLAKLRSLLAKAKKTSRSVKLVFVGDLVGRGPDCLEVLLEVASLGARAQAVLGNHDLHLLHAAFVDEAKAAPELAATLASADWDGLAAWLRRCPLALALDEVDALVVHAGIWPSWDRAMTLKVAAQISDALGEGDPSAALSAMYGEAGSIWSDEIEGGARLQTAVNVLTRMRCVQDGSIAWNYQTAPAQRGAGMAAWFDVPGRSCRQVQVLCGHWSQLGLLLRSDVVMLDNGAGRGRELAGWWAEDRKLVLS